MDFLNPLSLIFNLSLAVMNFYQLDHSMASNISATYSLNNVQEGAQLNKCPHSFDIKFTTANEEKPFLFKRMSHFTSIKAQPRTLLVDGLPHLLHDGEIIKAAIYSPRSLKVEVFNETLPHEKIVETMTFNYDGSLTYKAVLENDLLNKPQVLCSTSTYVKTT